MEVSSRIWPYHPSWDFSPCFLADFYNHALPHFAKLGALRGAWERLSYTSPVS